LEVDRMMKVRKSRNNRKQRILAALCALTLAAGQMSVASAGEPADEEQESTFAGEAGNVIGVAAVEGDVESIYPDAENLADNEELFAGYVQKMLYGTGTRRKVRSGSYGESRLTGVDLEIYRQLKEQIVEVAAGTKTTTQFTVNYSKSWTASDLGVENLLTSDQTGLDPEAEKAINEQLKFDPNLIVDCLLQDCPYELYWYDKTAATKYHSGTFSYNNLEQSDGTSSLLLEGSWLFSFPVAKDYAKDYKDSENYTTDLTKTSAVTTAVETANAIVTENKDKSDYEKLVAYKEKICWLVSYNHDAIAEDYAGGYGNPWQLIYVFDGNTDTNVVCEGYSKAFQYLCDLSTFDNVVCYTVSGTMDNGDHMWNIVKIGDINYLVDLTNSDSESIGVNGGLFLVGPTEGTMEDGYTFYVGSTPIVYKIRDDHKELYGEKIRFTEEKCHVTIKKHPDNETVTEGEKSELKLQVKAVTTNAQPKDTEDKITYQWYSVGANGKDKEKITGATSDTYNFSLEQKEGTYRFYCEVSCGESTDGADTSGVYTRNSLTATVKVVAKNTHLGSAIQYSGSGEKEPSCNEDGVGHEVCTICQTNLKYNVTVPKLGHDYGTPEFTWTADGTQASAKFTCQRTGCTDTEEGHVKTVTADITAGTSVPSTCAVQGSALYTATVSSPDGKSYTDTKKIMLPLCAHTWASAYTVDVQATETTAGSESIHCSVCGTIKEGSSRTIPVNKKETSDDSSDGTSSEAGTKPSAETAQENDSPKTPEKGDVVKDRNKKAEYAVTKIEDKKSGTAAYKKSTDKNATAISVPNTVKIDGVTYKVTSVQTEAFKNCKKLKSITIGNNITSIDKRAFKGCSSLKTITIKSTKLTAKSLSSKAFAGIGKNVVIKVPKGKLKAYTKLFHKKGLSKSVKIIS
jgi:hypothetical protein